MVRNLFLSLLLCGLLIACDNKEDNLILEKSNIEIKAKLRTLKSEVKEKSVTSSDLVTIFTSDDIVSYNSKTGEIILKNVKKGENPGDVYRKCEGKLEFYKEGELLFKLKIILDINSAIYNIPIVNYSEFDGEKFGNKWTFYILDGYPWGIPIGKYKQSKNKERIENVEKMLKGWNVFIERLKKEGKYIE